MPDNLLSPSFKFHFEGNADESSVREGYTFYSNSESLRTGTLTDRNTVGKNGCVGMNSSYPKVAFSYSSPQVTTLLDGARALAILAPYGHYNGGTYVGANQDDVANAIGLRADILVSWANVLGIQGTNKGYDAGWSAGVTASRIYKETDWVLMYEMIRT